jgi:hypothetical protein
MEDTQLDLAESILPLAEFVRERREEERVRDESDGESDEHVTSSLQPERRQAPVIDLTKMEESLKAIVEDGTLRMESKVMSFLSSRTDIPEAEKSKLHEVLFFLCLFTNSKSQFRGFSL